MKKNNLIIWCAFVLLAITACKKQLDAPPKDALVEGTVIINQQTANTAMNGVYYRFANTTTTSSANYTNWTSNQVYPGIITGYLDDGNNTINEASNNFGKTGFNSIWGRYYSLINAANGIVDQVTPLSGTLFSNGRKEQLLAEARFMRAFGHFKILCFFGQWFDINSAYGVIIQNKFITATTYAKARSNVKDSYQFILDDLDYAIANAPATATSNAYVDKWCAMALKMRVLLNRGQGDDYAQAATLGNSIMSGSAYTLEANTKDIFYTKGLSSKEVMLGVVPQAGQSAYYYNTSGTYVKRSSYYVATTALNTLLAADPRKLWYIGGTGGYGKGFYFIKYVQSALTTTQLSEVSYAIRLSEVYLLTAEATARSGGSLTTAKTLLKTVMSKAGVTDFTAVDAATTTNDVLMQVYYEYVRNFVGEDDQYYFAMLRFPLATVTALRPTIKSTQQYIYPIPPSEFLNNPLIGDQNPGYSK